MDHVAVRRSPRRAHRDGDPHPDGSVPARVTSARVAAAARLAASVRVATAHLAVANVRQQLSGRSLDPSAFDYDCLGGSGDGPLYTGRVVIVGYDRFELDRDGDGIGCD